MSAINDGGPAFPVAEDHKVAADLPWTCGMTLRDYFAAKAMQGMLADHTFNHDPGTTASLCYGLADAMLAARAAQ